MNDIKDRLNEALKAHNMTPAELARRSGVDKGSISRYLSGKFEPKQSAVHSMAKALNVSPSWLLGYEVPPDYAVTDESGELVALIEQLKPDDKAALRSIVESLLSKYKEAPDDNAKV